MKPDGVGHYWGNFFNAPQEPIEPGRWYCVEAMLQANSKPEASDGEQAFWVDGKRIGHFKGIRWRSSDKLKLNSFWLLDYVSDEVMKQSSEKYPDRVYEVWFDDIVVATDYIGPVQGKFHSSLRCLAVELALACGGLAAEATVPAPERIHTWQRWEHALTSTRPYDNPYANVFEQVLRRALSGYCRCADRTQWRSR
jgi:hypothetical protein